MRNRRRGKVRPRLACACCWARARDRCWEWAGGVPWGERPGRLCRGEVAAAGSVSADATRVRARGVLVEHRDGAAQRPRERVLRAFGLSRASGESGPVWSPSGRSLTFKQGSRLAIIRADGTGLRQLPQLTNGDGDPTWSPDGGGSPSSAARSAATGSTPCGATGRPTPRHSPGGSLARLVDHRHDRVRQLQRPKRRSCGPRGRHLTIRPDGSRLRRLFGRAWGTGQQPDWSPDGAGSPSLHAGISSPWRQTVDGCGG